MSSTTCSSLPQLEKMHTIAGTVHALKKLMFYGRTTPTATGHTTLTATGVLRLQLQAYDAYGYGRTTLMATGILGLRLRAYYAYGTGVSRLQLRACYRRTMGVQWGVS